MPELNVWLTLYIFLICLGISGWNLRGGKKAS